MKNVEKKQKDEVRTVRMAMLNSCLCCSLLQGTIISGVYATLVYMTAFTITVWWIAESEMSLGPDDTVGVVPLPGYLLGIGYLVIVVMSVFMLHGLYKQNEKALLAWLFVMVLFFFPEMGIVLFMSLYHWKIASTYGLADIIFYTFRAGINLLCLLCVQAQYTTWRDRTAAQQTLKRLESLQMGQMGKAALSLGYHNPGYINSESGILSGSGSLSPVPSGKSNGSIPHIIAQNTNLSRSMSSASQLGGYRISGRRIRNGVNGLDPYIQTGRISHSEFNASLYGAPGSHPTVLPHSRNDFGLYQERPSTRLSSGPMGMYAVGTSPYIMSPLGNYAHLRGFANPIHPDFTTQSLDRRKHLNRDRTASPTVEALNLRGPLANQYITYLRPTRESKSSVGAESDEQRRYRDVAL